MQFQTILIILIITALACCTNPFSTREPEKPDSGNQIYENTTEPKIVLDNMINAIKEKNVNEYKKLFISEDDIHSFTFEPEPSFIEFFLSKWTIQDEEAYFSNLVSQSTGNYPILNLTFDISQDEYPFREIISGTQGDSVQTESMSYIFNVNDGDSIAKYSGNVKFKLFRSEADQFWYIYYWRDNAIDENYNQTWTNLKIQNYLGK